MPGTYEKLSELLNSQSKAGPVPYSNLEDKIRKVVEAHSDKNFVQRMLNPNIFPVMQNVLTPGDVGTHLMSSGEFQGKGTAYPEIIQDSNTGKLIRLGRRAAMDYAIKNKQYLPFDTPEEAEYFGKNYKEIFKTW